jgi:hypothetical protein
MFNPATGNIEPYVETWRRFPSISGQSYCVLELVAEGAEGDRGYLGRVGDHALGCGLRRSGDYVAWREQQGNRVFEFGSTDSILPPLPKELPDNWKVGGTCVVGALTFVVRAIGVCA